jgi:Mrp family chromosome partitioning ATPase/capsular polysaccharide biosynthesis protein
VIWRGRWIVVASMVVTLVAGAAYAKVRTPTYQSTALIQLQGLQVGQAGTSGVTTVTAPPALNDPVSLLGTPAVARSAARLLHASDPAALAASVTGSVNTTGTVFAITVTGHDAEAVANTANAFADAFVLQVSRTVNAAVANIQAQIDSLSNQINQLKSQSTGGSAAATAELQAATAELTSLYGQKTALSVAGPGYAQIQHRATVSTVSTGFSKSKIAGIALVVGLLAGCGIALARSQLDTRLHSKPELVAVAGVPVLAELPTDRRIRSSQRGKLEEPGPALAEALRELRTTLQVALEEKPCPVVLVTSPSPGDGKTMVVANLGVAWALSGRRVVVVSADLRRPELEQALGVTVTDRGLCDLASLERRDSDASDDWPLRATAGSSGSSEFHTARPLPDRNAVAAALVPTDVPGLAVLPCGGVARRPSELLGSPAMHAVMDRLVGLADLVIIDTPPVLAVSDAAELARQVDGVVLVASEGKTSVDAVDQAIARLNAVKAHVIGVVLNRARRAPSTTYTAYYDAAQADAP